MAHSTWRVAAAVQIRSEIRAFVNRITHIFTCPSGTRLWHLQALFPETPRAYASSHIPNNADHLCSVLVTNPRRGLTNGSNRSLRSLGPAKAGPLTKR